MHTHQTMLYVCLGCCHKAWSSFEWIFVLALDQEASEWLVYMHKQKQEVGHCLFMAPCSLCPHPWHFLVAIGRQAGGLSAISGAGRGSKGTLCVAIGKQWCVRPETGDVTRVVMSQAGGDVGAGFGARECMCPCWGLRSPSLRPSVNTVE